MVDDPYRDELEAAHQRIAALEAELAEPAPPAEDRLDPLLRAHLLPDEKVLWAGGPDPSRKVFRRRHVLFGLGLGFFAFWLVVGMLRGMPPAFSVPAGSFLLLMGGVAGIKAKQALGQARTTRYALTDRRVLLVEPGDEKVTVRALPLGPALDVTLQLRRSGHGDLVLRLPDREPLTMPWLEEPSAAYRQLTAAVDQRRALKE